MADLRSWAGSILSLVTFFVVRRFTVGLAAPTFVAALVACLYAWRFVLRIPEVRSKTQRQGVPCEPEVAPAASSTATKQKAQSGAVDVSVDTKAVQKESTGSAAPVPASVEVVGDSAPLPAAHCAPDAEEAEHGEREDDADGEQNLHEASSSTARCVPVYSKPATSATSTTPTEGIASAVTERVEGASVIEEAKEISVPAAHTPTTTRDPAIAATAPSSTQRSRNTVEKSDASDDGETTDEEDRQKQEEAEFADPERALELKQEGNDHFKAGRVHDAREAYSEALHLTPASDTSQKAVLYSNRAACHQKVSRWDDVIADCSSAIELDAKYVKAYCRRSNAYEQKEKWHDSAEDLKKAIELDPELRSKEYKRQAVLEARAQEQFAKDKDEMMGKLKDLGNTVLGKFGMSCDNFKMEQDPVTGSYSMKYGS